MPCLPSCYLRVASYTTETMTPSLLLLVAAFLSSFSVATCIPSMLASTCMHSTCPQAFYPTLAYTSSATSSCAKQSGHSLHTAALESATARFLDALALALLRCFLPSLLNTILPQYHPAELQNKLLFIDCNMFTSAPRVVCSDSGIYICAKQTLLANPRSCSFQEFCLLPYLVINLCNRQFFGPARSRYGRALNKNWTGPIRGPAISGLSKVETLG